MSNAAAHPRWTQVCDGNICMLVMPSMSGHHKGWLRHKVLSGQHDSSAKSFLAVLVLSTALPCAGILPSCSPASATFARTHFCSWGMTKEPQAFEICAVQSRGTIGEK